MPYMANGSLLDYLRKERARLLHTPAQDSDAEERVSTHTCYNIKGNVMHSITTEYSTSSCGLFSLGYFGSKADGRHMLAGCKRNGVPCQQENCAQRSCSQELHV